MKIKELYLKGFGKFKDKKVVLEDGLNIIYGPNEAGKSTLHDFIEGMFFGFVKPGVKIRKLLETHEKYQPWAGEFYEGYMIYEIDGGKFRTDRNFARSREGVKIYDDISGEDITFKFKYDKNTREYLFCQQQLGLNQTVFKNTISIGHLGSKNNGEQMIREVGTRLSNISSAGDSEVSVAKAEKLLKEVLDTIGTQKASTREYGKLVRQKYELEEMLDMCRQKVESLRRLQQQLKEFEVRMEATIENRKTIENKIREAEGGLFLKRWENIKTLKEKEENLNGDFKALGTYSDFHPEYYEEIVTLQEIIEEKKEETRRLKEKISEMFQGIDKHKTEPIVCMDNKKELEAGSLFSHYLNLKEREKELMGELENLIEQLEGLKSGSLPGEADLIRAEELEDRINRLKREKDDAGYYRLTMERASLEKKLKKYAWRFILPVAITLASIPLGILVHPLFYGLVGSALIAYLYGFRGIRRLRKQKGKLDRAIKEMNRKNGKKDEELRKYREEIEEILTRWGVDSIYMMRAKSREYRIIIERIHRLEDRIEDKNRELDRICCDVLQSKEQLGEVLEEFGITVEGDIDDNHLLEFNTQFDEGRRVNEKLIGLKGRLGDLKSNLDRQVHVLKKREERLACILSKAGVTCIEDYKAGLEKYSRFAKVSRELEEVRKLLESKLDGEDYGQLKAAATELINRIKSYDEAPDKDELIVLKSRLEDIREEQGKTTAAMEKVKGSIETLQKDFVSPADAEEDMERINDRLKVLEQEREAAGLALEFIREASAEVHSEFAPVLNQKVGDIVERITGGRYKELRITRDLEIYAKSPETGRQVRADFLSGGTVDQFYFACRMAIVDILSGRSDLPFVLDDSFAQYDLKRLENIMAYLLEVSRDRQIMIFTCHHRDREVAAKLAGRFNYIEI